MLRHWTLKPPAANIGARANYPIEPQGLPEVQGPKAARRLLGGCWGCRGSGREPLLRDLPDHAPDLSQVRHDKPACEFTHQSARHGHCKACYAELRRNVFARMATLDRALRPGSPVRSYYDQDPDEVLNRSKRRRAERLRVAPRMRIDRETIFERDGRLCGSCGEVVKPEDATLDHIAPVAHGGAHTAARRRGRRRSEADSGSQAGGRRRLRSRSRPRSRAPRSPRRPEPAFPLTPRRSRP